MAHANHSQEATTYFNLHTVGIGYLNRVREVQVRRGQPFMACDIAAPVSYTHLTLPTIYSV